MRRDYLGFVERLHREHGDLAVTQLGHEQVWDLMSPELAREALVNHADHLIRWERGIEVFAEAFGQSVLITEGALWQRRMLMPAFTPKRVAGYAALMTDAARTALDAAVARPLAAPAPAEGHAPGHGGFERLDRAAHCRPPCQVRRATA